MCAEIDRRSKQRHVGSLQDIRKTLKNHARRVPGQIFGTQTVHERWAFHLGGRQELQFNIGFEDIGDNLFLRYRVAFSLEASRTLPDISALFPKIERLNEYLRVYPDQFADLRMWHYSNHVRSDDYSPSVIPPERCAPHTFIFLGQRSLRNQIDFELVLDIFDRLLPLYEFVEGTTANFPAIAPVSAGLQFKPGCRVKRLSTVATPAQRQLDVALRHNAMQESLFNTLAGLFGSENVGTELSTGNGTRVDVAVRHSQDVIWLYEIKTDLSARSCVRAAIAQLLEYSLWPTSTRAARLVVVGEPKLDKPTSDFLEVLRTEFGLPVYYAQLEVASGKLIDSTN